MNWLNITIKWVLFLILNQITNFLSLFLTPVVVLFASEDGWLPNWLWWFQTPDNPLDGDAGWKTGYRPITTEDTKLKRYYNRVRWLYRNKLYGFSEAVLSIKYTNTQTLITTGNHVSNGPLGESGTYIAKLYEGDKLIGFKYYYIRQYKHWPTKCIRILIGWKINENPEPGKVASFGFSPSPWMHFIP
jgi:hypothetical protein